MMEAACLILRVKSLPQPREEVQSTHHSSGSGIRKAAFSRHTYYSSAKSTTSLVMSPYSIDYCLVYVVSELTP